MAKNSLKAGVSIDVIAEITGFSVDYIEKIQEKKFSHNVFLLNPLF
nr:hypothetical protein [Wolbachia pipientis]